MKTSRDVRIKFLILITSFIASEVHAEDFAIRPELECGIYEAYGTIYLNNQNEFIMAIQKNTSSPYELILLGGDFKRKLISIGLETAVSVYVYKKLKSNNPPYVLFQNFLPLSNKKNEGVFSVRAEKCGLPNMYVQNH